jgi:hypothetical protein
VCSKGLHAGLTALSGSPRWRVAGGSQSTSDSTLILKSISLPNIYLALNKFFLNLLTYSSKPFKQCLFMRAASASGMMESDICARN